MYDDADLEEIECRLYSQVYHCTAENEEVSLPSESNLTVHAKDKRNNHRYFSKAQVSDQPSFIPLEQKDSTNSDEIESICNSISFNPNSTNIATEGNLGNQFQNNITVNQYTLPLIINPELSEVLNPTYRSGQFFIPWRVQNKKLLDKKNRRRQKKLKSRRQKNRDKANQNNLIEQNETRGRTQRGNITVYVSDDSDSECVIVSDMYKKSQKSSKLDPGSSKPLDNDEYDSDEIIYVPPPPVEVINVDEEEANNDNVCEISGNANTTKNVSDFTNSDLLPSNKTNELIEPRELSPESCTSNDFLDNSSVENNTSRFNFGLHGSDFNNTGDFVRPANPVEYCETESSCSTNDFNKESNCVKTIVFSEVDFPREDIFSEKNLEGFGSYITPKRKTSEKSNIKSPSKLSKPVKKIFNNSDSSSSSSETDCESPTTINKNIKIRDKECNKKLPTLSPMLCDKNVTKTKSKSLKHNSSQTFNIKSNHSDKRKCDTINSTDSDNDANVEESKLSKKKASRKKKKSSNKKRTLSEDQNKQVIQNNDPDQNETNAECVLEHNLISTTATGATLNKEININSLETETLDENVNNNKHSLEPCHANPEDINTNILTTSCKKKKKRSVDSKKMEMESTSNSSSGETTSENTKKKKRKSVSENSVRDLRAEELSQSLEISNEISIDNMENGANNKNPVSDNPLSVDSTRNRSEQQIEEELENISNSNNLSVQESSNVGENCTSNKTLPVCSEPPTLQILDGFESDEELIVVDEILSDEAETNVQNCVEIIVSSDSEQDFQELGDVGHDLTLANCLVNVTDNECIDVDNSSTFTNPYVMNKNLCEDYSKFDVEQIQSIQTDDPDAWKILPRDRLMFLNTNNNKGPRCHRCRQFGHLSIRCTEKPYPPNCILCGFSGHEEPRCPNKICNQCGNEGDYSTTFCWKCMKFRNMLCHLCNMRGHIAKTCPDLWRRYHLTTEEGPIVVSNEPQLKPRDQLWCSGCAKQGHLEHECNYYNRQYPPSNPCIVSYEDVLQQENRNRFPDDRTVAPALPPQPVWITHEQNNLYGNMSPVPFHNQPSTSQGAPLYIPPMSHVTNIKPLPEPAINQSEMSMPADNVNPNLTAGPTKVLNPFSVLITKGKNTGLDRMMSDYVSDGNNLNHMGCFDGKGGKPLIHPQMVKQGTIELLKNDQRRIKQIFLSMPAHVVKQFIRKELADLENVVSRSDPKYLKKQLFKYDRIAQSKRALHCEVVKEKCFWYRILNMFIFGVHHLRDGRIHINFIKRYVSEPKQNKLDNHKRKSLLNAYNYIFDGNRHVNVNYYKVMQKIIQKKNPES